MAIIPTSGEFTKVPEGGGNGAFVITATAGVFDNSVSYNDIRAAVDGGQTVFVINKKNNQNNIVAYLTSMFSAANYSVRFSYVDGDYSYRATSAEAPLTFVDK